MCFVFFKTNILGGQRKVSSATTVKETYRMLAKKHTPGRAVYGKFT